MREITINNQTMLEEIKSYDYNIGSFVRVLVGLGSIVDGKFTFFLPQQYDTIIIQNEDGSTNSMTGEVIKPQIDDLTDLEAQYPGGSFLINDLWPYIDRIRARRT